MRDVAERAGVSATTVSHVINGTRPVSEELRTRVLAAMDALDYRPNLLARSLRRGQAYLVGMIIPDVSNPYFAEVARGVEDTVCVQDYSVILCNTDNDPRRERLYATALTRNQVGGMLLASVDVSADDYRVLRAQRIPLVMINRDAPGEAVDQVLTNSVRGGYLATRHLVELGHRRIACITGPSQTTPSAERVTGYRQALREEGIEGNGRLVLRGDFQYGGGYRLARQLLTSSDPPTAVFAVSDMMALGVLCAAQEMGLKVPADLSVVGYDDIQLASFTSPPLTTVFQPKYETGVLAATLLLERMRDRELPPRRRVLDVRLESRQSCAPPSRGRTS
jgi:LacI family transcriptional regulator